MRMRNPLVLSGLAAALTVAAAAVPARAQTQVGTLTCNVAPGAGFVVGSSKALSCLFQSQSGRRDLYAGTINRIGVDIGATGPGRLVWSVFAPSDRIPSTALAGAYAGAGAQATVGAGLGANVLIGGNDRTISLQPLSVQGQTGLNVAGGITSITLEPGEPPRRRRR